MLKKIKIKHNEGIDGCNCSQRTKVVVGTPKTIVAGQLLNIFLDTPVKMILEHL
jgi:hypothetical protein